MNSLFTLHEVYGAECRIDSAKDDYFCDALMGAYSTRDRAEVARKDLQDEAWAMFLRGEEKGDTDPGTGPSSTRRTQRPAEDDVDDWVRVNGAGLDHSGTAVGRGGARPVVHRLWFDRGAAMSRRKLPSTRAELDKFLDRATAREVDQLLAEIGRAKERLAKRERKQALRNIQVLIKHYEIFADELVVPVRPAYVPQSITEPILLPNCRPILGFRYRNPQKPRQFWCGKGLTPKWWHDAIRAGQTEHDMRWPKLVSVPTEARRPVAVHVGQGVEVQS